MEPTALYRMLQSGESPDFGQFEAGQVRELPTRWGGPLAARGVAEEVKQTKAQPAKAVKEAEPDGE